MSLDDVAVKATPRGGEAQFKIGEVIYSRTDKRGVIQAGNAVFRRISGYDWSDLIGAPQKILRHADMPRGVFEIFWNRLKAGKTVGAYIKNRTKDGGFYWVFAIVLPCEGGYMSARVKPVSDRLTSIKALYAELLSLEKQHRWEPAASARWLEEQFEKQGFEDYQTFMTQAMSEELVARNASLGREPLTAIQGFADMRRAAADLTRQTERLISEFEMTEIIPINFRVIASRLEPNGGPISTLSTNYGGMSRDMSSWFETNVVGENSNFSKIGSTVTDSVFLQSVSRITQECAEQLEWERGQSPEIDLGDERERLAVVSRHYDDQSREGRSRLADESRRILDACKKMNRHMLGLSTTRVMCKIEGALLSSGQESLTDIIGELSGFQQRIRDHLSEIEALSHEIRGHAV
ncbi:MAG: PAS domain-containing protein [Pseudomonadota bacterium]